MSERAITVATAAGRYGRVPVRRIGMSQAAGVEELADAIVRVLRAPVALLDDQGVVVRTNPAFEEIVDRPAGELVGRPFLEVAARRWDLTEAHCLLEERLGDGPGIEGLELRAQRTSTRGQVVLVDASPLRLDGSGRALMLVALEDVTERYHLQERARVYARDLERSNRELEGFAHAASHDLQEPLRKIRLYANRLPELLEPAAPDERASRYLRRLGEAAGRMQARIEDLLQLGRVGRSEPALERTDLNDVLDDVQRDLGVAIAESGAAIHVGELPVLEADPVQLRLLFQNLLGNALKFHTPHRPPVVRVRAETVESADSDEHRLHTLIVEDDGIGFEQEYAERIFVPFERLHGRAEYEGTGVGLSLCRRVVEHHGGSIRAEGRPGEGARFVMTLPDSPVEGRGP